MEIQFDMKGDPEGGRVTNYLLEKVLCVVYVLFILVV